MNANKLYEQFDEFPQDLIKEKFNFDIFDNLDNNQVLKQVVLDYYRPTLIYLINEKRVSGWLEGNTSEERYNYFNQKLCKHGEILEEINQRFPEINKRIEISITKHINLYSRVLQAFISDFNFLCSCEFLKTNDTEPDLKYLDIEISGDVHNGSGVCIVTYKEDIVVYKKKSILPNKFIKEIDSLVSNLLNRKISFIPNFYERGEYYWEQHIKNDVPLRDDEAAKEYYTNMGFLLFYAYIFNISDLHFENIISSETSPLLVDIETLFSISPYNVMADNLATKYLVEKSRGSVLTSGLLPVSETEKLFGGDLSGILGGSLVNEFKTVTNLGRDDIRYKKVVKATKHYSHLPFFLDKEKKVYLTATNYLDAIVAGFELIGEVFIKNKNKFIEVLMKYPMLESRILFRNTQEYEVVSQLLVSPVYSKKNNILFEKMSDKLSHFNSKYLCESEVRQLLNMDIPSFTIKANSTYVTDGYKNIWSVDVAPIEVVVKKLDSLNGKSITEQIELIKFSIQASEDTEDDKMQDMYRSYANDIDNEDNLFVASLYELVDELIDKKITNVVDRSINWLTLKVNNQNNFELVPMDNSIYDGLSGVAVSLIECYSLLDNGRRREVYKCLELLFTTLLNSYPKMVDMTYYVGKIGVLSTMIRISEITNQKIPKSYLDERNFLIEQSIAKTPADFLTGFSSSILSLHEDGHALKILSKAAQRFEETVQYDSNYIYWGNKESNNTSLAHGNAGIQISLLYLAGNLKSSNMMNMYREAMKFDEQQKLSEGWIDKRFSESNAHWCHGSTGVLLSRLAQMKLNDKFKILNDQELYLLKNDINHAIRQIINIGFDMNNFTLCHGVSGNLLALTYYYNIFGDKEFSQLDKIIGREYLKMVSFGRKYGWMCSFNTNYNSYGLMTGTAGIIYSLSKYLKEDSSLEILVPVF